MSKKSITGNIKLKSYNDLFESDVQDKGSIIEIPIEQLHAFKEHPFLVLDDDKMDETVESVEKYGILVPGIARKRKDGEYEIVSGHRRKHAAEIVGLKTMPMIVKELTDDEATIIMVDANIQREDILPSEKAKAYSMKYEAMKHQGAKGGNSLAVIGESYGESMKTVQRFIYLARLSDELLKMIDENKLGIGQGLELSWIDKVAQETVYEILCKEEVSLSVSQAIQIKELFREGKLTERAILTVVNKDKQKPHKRKITFNSKKLDHYFDTDYSDEEIENLIISLLDEWKERGGKLE